MQTINVHESKGEFFKILATTDKTQIGVMTLQPGADSGPEDIHTGDQIVYIIEGETGVGELGVGPKRKTGARRGEVWPGELSAESYAWPRRKAGPSAGEGGGPAQNRTSDLCVGARIVINGKKFCLNQGEAIIIPTKAKHHIYNDGKSELFFLTMYAPPQY